MVMNSFGKRNFMQPMGRPNCTQGALLFFLLGLVGWEGEGRRIFFQFSLVLNVFPLCFL
jgi:hypothetical protein